MLVAHLQPVRLSSPAPACRLRVRRPSCVAAVPGRRHPNSQWPTGVPPRMGEHLMPSGRTAPPSTSTTSGTGLPHLFQYHGSETAVTVEVHASGDSLSAAAARLFVEVCQAAVARKGAAVVALSGGSLPARLAGVAGAQGLDWSKVTILLADERCVGPEDPLSSLKALKEAFADAVPKAHLLAVPSASGPVAQAAAYEAVISAIPAQALPRNAEGLPVLDLVLLGIGPDGHTASLFPNRTTLKATKQVVLPVSDSPKAPLQRVTLSLSAINAASAVAFVVGGADKAEVVQRCLEVQALPGALPAQAVRPMAGEVRWMLDAAAAAALTPREWDAPAKWPRSEVPAPTSA